MRQSLKREGLTARSPWPSGARQWASTFHLPLRFPTRAEAVIETAIGSRETQEILS